MQEDDAVSPRNEDRMSRSSYAPAAHNSVTAGWVTAPKDQTGCGACTAFATTSAVETCMLKAGSPLTKETMDPSEQTLVDCGYKNCKLSSIKFAICIKICFPAYQYVHALSPSCTDKLYTVFAQI